MKTGVNGRLHLHFSCDQEQTKLRVKTQHPPLRVIRAFEHETGVALVHFHNVSGGILGGDQFDIQIDVEPNAHALITTTGANRIYRHRDGYIPAKQQMRVHVSHGAMLEYIPDATIPFADSHFIQQTEIKLEQGAKLFWSEILAPGRTAFNEQFAWREFESDFRIERVDPAVPPMPIMIERWKLQPAVDNITSLARMGEWTHNATFYACHAGISQANLHQLEAELTQIAHALSDPDEVVWGVSRLVQDGVVVRGLSKVGRTLPQQIEQFHNRARLSILDKPLVLPRKIY